MQNRRIPRGESTRLASFGGTVYSPLEDWGPAIGLDRAQASLIGAAMAIGSGNTALQLAVQTATVRTEAPDPWAVVTANSGLTVNGNGRAASAVMDIASLTAGKAFLRWGVALSLSSGATGPGSIDATLAVAGFSLGQMIGSWRGELSAAVQNDAVIAVTGFVPALWAQAVMAAFNVTSASSTFRCRLVYRVAAVSPELAGPWTDITNETNQGGEVERNTGNLALSLGSNLLVQFGVAYSSASGASVGDVAVSVGVRRS